MSTPEDLPPVVDDVSAFIIAGRVSATETDGPITDGRTPAQGIEDGIEAEQLGFNRIFLSERWNLKEAAVILAGIGAQTTRIDLGTGLLTPASRHPLHMAALGSTMQACFGPRFIIGLGRGDNDVFAGMGLKAYSFNGFMDYVDILKRLWKNEAFGYDGPAGAFDQLAMVDVHEGPDPQLWYGTFALPRGADATARRFDGVLLPPNMTPDATAGSVKRLHDACEAVDRDPSTVRIAQCVITAPELSDEETRQVAHARALTYLQAPGYGESLCAVNGWDTAIIEKLGNHAQFKDAGEIADNLYHRSQMMEPAELVPDEWMDESCALGSIDNCVNQFQRFREAGADEIVTYGSTPGQNAGLIKAWAAHSNITM